MKFKRKLNQAKKRMQRYKEEMTAAGDGSVVNLDPVQLRRRIQTGLGVQLSPRPCDPAGKFEKQC